MKQLNLRVKLALEYRTIKMIFVLDSEDLIMCIRNTVLGVKFIIIRQ